MLRRNVRKLQSIGTARHTTAVGRGSHHVAPALAHLVRPRADAHSRVGNQHKAIAAFLHIAGGDAAVRGIDLEIRLKALSFKHKNGDTSLKHDAITARIPIAWKRRLPRHMKMPSAGVSHLRPDARLQ